MITKNLKVGDKFKYKSYGLEFEAICTYSDEGNYKETITRQGTSQWKPGTTDISSHEEENNYITLINQNPMKLTDFKIKGKNEKQILCTIRKGD